ncbi:SAV_915 family protein [Streptomyces sp. NBC_01190]|uniref:SAV_915 family protein n=1 Tax=Streptomyces sp. NBC_01190 TaxID=2903767 RepID=UPI0038709FFD
MSSSRTAEDAEPLDRVPAGHPLYVPVRSGPLGYAARFFRTPLGGRTAVAFTSEQRLIRTLGAGQEWIRLSEPALRALAAPLGVATLRIDPRLSAPAARHAGSLPLGLSEPTPAPVAEPARAAVGVAEPVRAAVSVAGARAESAAAPVRTPASVPAVVAVRPDTRADRRVRPVPVVPAEAADRPVPAEAAERASTPASVPAVAAFRPETRADRRVRPVPAVPVDRPALAEAAERPTHHLLIG